MEFSYIAKDNDGKRVEGVLTANNEKSVVTLIKNRGLFPISIKQKGQHKTLFQRKVPLKEKIVFSQQLAIMIKSGLPIVDAIKSLRDETENARFARELNGVIAEVEGGSPLSTALGKYPKTFNEIYVNLIKSGEKSGKLELVLERLTEQLEKDYDLSHKIRGALSYPIFVLSALVIVMVLVLVVIIPQLEVIFADAGIALPLSTRIIIKASYFVKSYGLYIFIFLAALCFLGLKWRKTKKGRHFFDRAILFIPVIGSLLRKSYMARFTRTFSTLTASGLPLLDVLKVSSDVVGNILYEDDIMRLSEKIKSGASISASLKESPLFPGMVGQLASVGERSGSLDEVFDSLANFYDREVDNITSNLSALLEPFLILVMGVGIGAVIISVLQPIYGLVNAI